MRNLLRKIHFGHLLCKFSLFRVTKRLKCTQNLPQNDFPSRRLSFSDSLLVTGADGQLGLVFQSVSKHYPLY
ncbi:hypothetical protein MNBD_GAMMA03-1325 [hydrothermal vent metagenome]|uniref:Uncharacterized protein n=1 Tax=hydrothermal vent metagenome TaxID=652676 RepID=A0A3B0VVA4_9ZZZZ